MTMRMLPIITAVSLTVASGAAYAMGVGGRRVSAGTKWPLIQARVPGRPKGCAFLAVGSHGVFHVQLCSRRCILTELTRASTITRLQIDFGL